MNVTRMILAGALGFGLMSPTAMHCDSTKKWLGLFATATGAAISYVFFSEAAKQTQLLDDHKKLARQFEQFNTSINDLSKRLANKSCGADIKEKEESDAIKHSINELYSNNLSYINNSPTIIMAFSGLNTLANDSVLLGDAPCYQEGRDGRLIVYPSLRGWLAAVSAEVQQYDAALKKRPETLQSRKVVLSRLGMLSVGASLVSAAALTMMQYWPKAKA